MSLISGNPTITSPQVERLSNGTIVSVGKHQVEIVDYIAEGGFSQIYKVKFIDLINVNLMENNSKNKENTVEDGNAIENKDLYKDTSLQPGELACLKRVIVQDDNGLNELRNEVNVMQQLKHKPNIIQLFDSNAQRYTKYSPNGFEILLLMELCPNKSLLDYMNQRLATKLSEKEILKIMYDTTLAISQMHYLDIPLIHRDIKIENVLVDKQNNFKLCDFGSTSTTFPVVTTHHDIAILSHDIYVHTTPQYRSPEMIDLYKCLPIDEKSDIWALGVFLYKLLFFITPFERTGQFAILHSKFEFPNNKYSSKLINLIIIMLSENSNLRPNIYQVMYQLCEILQCPVPIPDKYGIGSYSFDQYMWFQKNSQNLQLQIFNLQNKLRQQNGVLSEEDNYILNQLYINSFNVLPSIPIPQRTSAIKTTTDFTNVKANPAEYEENLEQTNEMVTTTVKESELKDRNTRTINSPIYNNTAKEGLEELQKIDNQEIDIGERYFPSVDELNDYIDKKREDKLKQQLHQQQHKSEEVGQQQYVSVEYINPPTTTSPSAVPQSNTTTLKQHKSNNPFPKMNYDVVDGSSAQQVLYQYQQQQQQQQVLINSQMPVVTPIQPIRQNKYSTMVNNPQQAIDMQSVLVPPNEQDIAKQYKNSFSPASSVTSVSSALSSSSPPPVPPHPYKEQYNQNLNKNVGILDEDTKSLPEVPPRPVKKPLDNSLIDLSATTSTLSSPYLENNPHEYQNSATQNRKLEKDEANSTENKKLINPPTTESIEFDLESVKRKSLDMKLQRLAIESKALQDGASEDRKQYKDRHRASDEESITGMKKSFDQQRSLLDLERFNNEIQRDQKKKHKLFSILRSDKRI